MLNGIGIVVVSFIGALILVVLIEYPMNNLIEVISNHISNIEDEPKLLGETQFITNPKIENQTIPDGRLCFKLDLKTEEKNTQNGKIHSKLE